MKNFNILGVHGKICVLGGGFTKSQNIGLRGLPKKGGLGQFADLRGGGGFSKKEEGSVFEGVVIPNAHYVHKSNGGQIAATKNYLLQLGLRTKNLRVRDDFSSAPSNVMRFL